MRADFQRELVSELRDEGCARLSPWWLKAYGGGSDIHAAARLLAESLSSRSRGISVRARWDEDTRLYTLTETRS